MVFSPDGFTPRYSPARLLQSDCRAVPECSVYRAHRQRAPALAPTASGPQPFLIRANFLFADSLLGEPESGNRLFVQN